MIRLDRGAIAPHLAAMRHLWPELLGVR